MGREQVAKARGSAPAQDDLGLEVGGVHLPNELTTPSAGRQDVEVTAVTAPHRDNLGDPILPGCDHGGDGAVLGAEASTRSGVDADSAVLVAGRGDERGCDVAEQSVTHAVWSKQGFRSRDQVIVSGCHAVTLPVQPSRDLNLH